MNTPTTNTPYGMPEELKINPVALVLALLLPGLGHAYLGETRRGTLIAVGILSMFVGGMLIGGIDVVDKREDLIWFVGESLVGPLAFGTDYVHQHYVKVKESPTSPPRSAYPYEIRDPRTGQPIMVRDPTTNEPFPFADPRTGKTRVATAQDRPPNVKSLGRVNEIGTLSCTLAGMLNLICVIDAATRRPVPRPRPAARPAAVPARGTPGGRP